MEEFAGGPALDAGLIAAAQAVEHYEIARYGALRSWAELAGLDEAEQLLEQTLDEERATDAAPDRDRRRDGQPRERLRRSIRAVTSSD